MSTKLFAFQTNELENEDDIVIDNDDPSYDAEDVNNENIENEEADTGGYKSNTDEEPGADEVGTTDDNDVDSTNGGDEAKEESNQDDNHENADSEAEEGVPLDEISQQSFDATIEGELENDGGIEDGIQPEIEPDDMIDANEDDVEEDADTEGLNATSDQEVKNYITIVYVFFINIVLFKALFLNNNLTHLYAQDLCTLPIRHCINYTVINK